MFIWSYLTLVLSLRRSGGEGGARRTLTCTSNAGGVGCLTGIGSRAAARCNSLDSTKPEIELNEV